MAEKVKKTVWRTGAWWLKVLAAGIIAGLVGTVYRMSAEDRVSLWLDEYLGFAAGPRPEAPAPPRAAHEASAGATPETLSPAQRLLQ
ncbi:MAG: hypothetical protein QGH45_23085 [Myxococcota bacterium]|jgi:hypothetical protein|nr:hypothetical protein [Myxococcota bacterium]